MTRHHEPKPTMSANVPTNVRGISSGFEIKDANRDKIGPSFQLPKDFFELKEKWCENCGRRHPAGQCQFLMVDQMIKEGVAEKEALERRLFDEEWEKELQRRLRNWRAVEVLRESHFGASGGNTVSAGQQQQQMSPRASRFTEDFEVSDSEGEYDHEDESDIDDESDSDASESALAPAPESAHAQKQSETEESMESEEALYLLVLLSMVLIVLLSMVCIMIFCVGWISAVSKSGLRFWLAV